MKTNSVTLLMAAVLLAGLAACGGGGNNSSSMSNSAPSITAQPGSIAVVSGNTATFTVMAAVVSSNGTQNAIVWAHENATPAVLHAYDAANLAHELYNSNQATGARDQFGPGNKFIVPVVAGGKVFVGTTNTLAVFGLLH